MKLQELMNQGYLVRGWTLSTVRGERRVILTLGRNEKNYVAHSPFVDTKISDVEFSNPVLLKR